MIKLKFYFKHISIFYASNEKCVITDPAVWALKQNSYVIDMDDAE